MSHPSKPRAPTPAEIKAARRAAKLTQTQAAELVHTTLRTWQQWESGDVRMHRAHWELFVIKVRLQDAPDLMAALVPK